jgi:hypothetical protein
LSGTKRVSEGGSCGPGEQEKIVMWRESGREAGLWWKVCLDGFRGWIDVGKWTPEEDLVDAFEELVKKEGHMGLAV